MAYRAHRGVDIVAKLQDLVADVNAVKMQVGAPRWVRMQLQMLLLRVRRAMAANLITIIVTTTDHVCARREEEAGDGDQAIG